MQLSKISFIFGSAKYILVKIYLFLQMQELYLKYRSSLISYRRFGEGPATLLCLHGYGEGSDAFVFLSKYIGDQYTVYAIDLPFHGKTDWKEGLNFSYQDLLSITEAILNGRGAFTLMGFSLGGRIALSLYQSLPNRVEKLVLLAPDGLKVNFWYWLATQTKAGNGFFALTMKYPGWFLGMLKLLNWFGLINASIFKFVNYYIGSKVVRQLLYNRWTALRKLRPGLHEIKSSIKQHMTMTRLIYGKHDRIILSSVGEKFREGIEEFCSLSVIASGHQVLHEKHAADIIEALR